MVLNDRSDRSGSARLRNSTVSDIRELGGGVVSPNANVLDVSYRNASLESDLSTCAVVIQTSQSRKVALR